jgi:phosphodiesterase/alkaline phosphatase D-like protein
MKRLGLTSAIVALVLIVSAVRAAEFQSAFPAHTDRPWIGAEYWANPLQDWRLKGGRLECFVSGADRNLQVLTHQLGKTNGAFTSTVRLGRLHPEGAMDPGWAGFRIGISGPVDDYRFAAIHGRGINLGITTTGKLFIGGAQYSTAMRTRDLGIPLTDVELTLSATPAGDNVRVVLTAVDRASGRRAREASANLPSADLAGNVGLVAHWDREAGATQGRNPQGTPRGGNVAIWFDDWKLSGARVEAHPEQAFGPILWSQYTLSKGVLKIAAQMPPIGVEDNQSVAFQVKDASGWKTLDEEQIHTLARTATFRIPGWDATKDTPYRLVYQLTGADGRATPHFWEGTIRHDPVEKETIVVAGFTGNQDTGFPNLPTLKNLRFHNPDLLFFSGDQIYENVAGYGIQRLPVETATLDYLRKWYLVGWSFGDLMRDRPTVHMPDDHDVYQGNIWGGGGRKQPLEEHERGGYVMAAEWVNMVQRTQTSHLPDPYDSRPIHQGITVYYTDLLYGRTSFGIIEDRKFKSGPKGLTPPTGGRPDHVTDPNFDRAAFDPPGATILGERQLDFIRHWTADWRGADFKVALSQTIFGAAATTHGAEFMRLVADLDTNGWPHSARDLSLRELRKGYTFMYAGDTHLPSLIHHGVEDWNDSGWSFCVPSIAAGYPRLYEPDEPGRNRAPGMPEYTGESLDPFHNKMTIWAVANPKKEWRTHPYERLMDKASGYGIVRLHKATGKITAECWPILVDASESGAETRQFPGWPRTINREDNFAKKGAAWLPRVEVSGMTNPVIQVVDEVSGEHVYTLRIQGTEWHPRVFAKTGVYTLRVGEPGTDFREFRGLRPTTQDAASVLRIAFR